jgi:hypothetical protein
MQIKRILYPIYYLFFGIKIRKYRNVHFGEECYIVADSSELRYIDMKLLDDKPAIFFNFSWLHKDVEERENVTYAHLVEKYIFYRDYELMEGFTRLKRFLLPFKRKNNFHFFSYITNFFGLLGYPTNFLYLKLPQDNLTKEMLSHRQFTFWSLLVAISLANYMGFSKAYLIGHSFSSSSLANHWYENKPISIFKDNNGNDGNARMVSKNFEFLFNSKELRLDIVGVTLDTPLFSFFPYVTYNQLFGVDPFFLPTDPNDMVKDHKFIEMMNLFYEKYQS